METTEIWADVEGFEGLYQVSDMGRIRSMRTGKVMSEKSLNGGGYVQKQLYKNGVVKRAVVHRLVASAFVEGSGPEVNHKNGCKTDNRAENLEWVTRSQNVSHAYYELGYRIRPVTAIGIDGTRKEYRSIGEAERDGFHYAKIYRCLNKPTQTHKGYYWRRPIDGPDGEAGDLAEALAWIAEATKIITDLAGGGSELFTRKGDAFRADLPVCSSRIRDRLTRAHEQMVKAIRSSKGAHTRDEVTHNA